MVLIVYMVVILDKFEFDLNFYVFFYYFLFVEIDGIIVVGVLYDVIL